MSNSTASRTNHIRRTSALALAGIAALAMAAPASAAERFASPTSGDAIGSCSSLSPCRVDHAINGAAAGDEVVVRPGTYTVGNVIAPGVEVNVHGAEGQARPRLVAAGNLSGDFFTMAYGGTLSNLHVETSATLGDALEIDGVIAENLVIVNPAGPALTLRGAGAGTVIRDSVVHATGSGTAVEIKDGTTVGTTKMLNVTVSAPSSTALKGKMAGGSSVVRNSILNGDDGVRIYKGVVTVDHSNFDPALSSGYANGGNNQSAAPVFVDAAGGNLREASSSPTINAGTSADNSLGVADPDGVSRAFGGAPDMGAYEYAGADQPPVTGDGPGDSGPGGDTSTGGSDSVLPPPAPPMMGKRLGVGQVKGSVRVQRAGSSRFVELDGDASIPVNSTIDASRGTVALTSALDSKGTPQTGQFWGGQFKVLQKKSDGMTELRLSGGSFRGCSASRSKQVQASKKRFVRRLWGRDRHGKFRTRGRRAQATVRGTSWLTEDRCDGTRFVVKEGAVAVRANGSRKSRLVRAGASYLVRAPGKR